MFLFVCFSLLYLIGELQLKIIIGVGVCIMHDTGAVGDRCESTADCSLLDGGFCSADGECRCPPGHFTPSESFVCTASTPTSLRMFRKTVTNANLKLFTKY